MVRFKASGLIVLAADGAAVSLDPHPLQGPHPVPHDALEADEGASIFFARVFKDNLRANCTANLRINWRTALGA